MSEESPLPGSGARDDAQSAREAPADAFKAVGVHLAEFRTFLAHYFSAKADAAKLSIRKIIIAIVLGIVGLLAVSAVLIASIVILLMGIANAIGALFTPPKPWAGELIVGAVVLSTAVAGVMVVLRKFSGASRARTVAKYESKHAQERRRYGHDVASATGTDISDAGRESENGEHLTESQFLARESDHAKHAMTNALKNAAREVGRGVDPRGWVQEHPWLTLGATALAGFFAARVIVPSQARSLQRELKKHLKEEAKARQERDEEARGEQSHGEKSKAGKGFEIAAIIGAELLKLVRPLLASMFSRIVAPPADDQPPENPEYPAQTAENQGDSSTPDRSDISPAA